MGDSAVPLRTEDLLAETVWLRTLAASLVRDPGTADDVAQETVIAALRHPPTGERRPWLARVARNFARQRYRSETRRARREETAVARRGEPSPAEIVERVETHQLLAQLVAGLSEPNRTALVMRYYQGLEPSEIATRLAVPPGTIRARIHRGLAELRERLDERNDGRRDEWIAVLAPMAAGHSLPRAAARRAPRWLVPLAAVAVVGVAVVVAAKLTDETPLASSPETSTAASPPVKARKPPRPPAGAGDATAATSADTSRESVRIGGRVLDPSGAPVRGARVTTAVVQAQRVWWDGGATSSPAGPGAVSGADGEFDLSAARGPAVSIRADAAGFAPAIVMADAQRDRTEVVLRLAVGASLAGAVIDEAGHGLAGARIAVFRNTAHGPEALGDGTAGENGAFRIDGLPADPRLDDTTFLIASAEGFAPLQFGTFIPNDSVRLALSRGTVIEGRVLDADGAPVAGARVVLRRYRPSNPAPLAATTGAAGRFRAGPFGVSGRFEYIAVVEAAGHGTTVVSPLIAPSATPIELRLRGQRVVKGHAVDDATGAPVAGVTFIVRDPAFWPMEEGQGSYGNSFERERVTSGADGSFEFHAIDGDGNRLTTIDVDTAASAWRQASKKQGWGEATSLEKDQTEITMRLSARAVVEGVVRLAGGGGPKWTGVRLLCPPDEKPRATSNTDDAGRYTFEISDVPDAPCVVVSGDGAAGVRSEPFAVVRGERVTVPPLTLAAAAPVRGSVTDAAGSPMPGVHVGFEGIAKAAATTGPHGAYVVDGLPPGPFNVFAWDETRLLAWKEHVTIAPDGTGVPPLVVARASRLEGVVVDETGEPVAAASVIYHMPNGASNLTVTDAAGRFVFDAAIPGAANFASWRRGHVADVRLTAAVPAADAVTIRLPREQRVAGRVLDENGEPWTEWDVRAMDVRHPNDPGGGGRALLDAAGCFQFDGLGPGPFQLSVAGAVFDGIAGGSADVELRLPPLEPIEGTLSTAAGAPLAKRTVHLRRDDVANTQTAARWESGGPQEASTDREGRFRFAYVRGGSYALWTSDGESHTVASARGVRPGATVALRLTPGRTIAGVLLAADGTPSAGYVTLCVEGWNGPSASGPADAEGRFRIEGAPAGQLAATASSKDGSERVTTDLGDPGLAEVRITMKVVGPKRPVQTTFPPK